MSVTARRSSLEFAGVTAVVSIASIGLLLAADESLRADAGLAVTLGLAWAATVVAAGLAWRMLEGQRSPGRAGFAGAVAALMAMALLGVVLGGGTLVMVPVMVLTVGLFLLPVGLIVGLAFWYARCRGAPTG